MDYLEVFDAIARLVPSSDVEFTPDAGTKFGSKNRLQELGSPEFINSVYH